MNLKCPQLFTSIFLALFLLVQTGTPVTAQPITITGLVVHTRTDPPAGWAGNPTVDPGWTSQGSGATTLLNVPPNGSLFFSFRNVHLQSHKKDFTIVFTGSIDDIGFLSVGIVRGYKTSTTANPVKSKPSWWRRTLDLDGDDGPELHKGVIQVDCHCETQPEWEVVEIKSSSVNTRQIQVRQSSATCAVKESSTGENGIPDSQMNFTDSMISAIGLNANFTEIQLFPRNVDVDPIAPQLMFAPPHTGNWISDIVFVDPYGDPRPHGGVRWVSDGLGVAAGEFHNLAITMMDTADTAYTIFALDAAAGQYHRVIIDSLDPPWYGDFESHLASEGAANLRGWKGWDADPAFDAVVTDEQQNGGINSVKIEGDSDLVKEFEGADTGHWVFSAWQYIPSDFESGGTGLERGSWFLLLNTYNDGGPYNWSVGLQADSDTGLMKIYQGDGTSTFNVPYETDRWVKIQAEIDLNDDWTRVYYDDELVAEYSWTGGVFGGGAGELDIAAVDLFANNSTSIYYDDLSLTRRHVLLGDVNLDGSVNLLDVGPFIDRVATSTYQPEADTNEDGEVNLLDVDPFISILGSG